MLNKSLFKKKFKKFLIIMRISLFICLAFMGSVFAEDAYSQANKYYSVTLKNTTIRQAISEIERQSDYFFIVADEVSDELNRIINLSINKRELSEILETLFSGTNLLYMISGRQVFISKSEIDLGKNKLQWQQKAEMEDEEAVVQGIQITGRVTDMNGDPLPGATIIIKGTTTGTVSDVDGQFSITVPDVNTVLQFTYIGFITQEIAVGQKRTVNVTLLEATAEMEEVVVVAYGSQKKVSITAAISSANTKELKVSSSASLANALAGRVSGLTSIQRAGGQPGRDDASMYLRGVATTNGVSPLILIDGVPRDNIRTIDPNEVESVTVLKDASATAVFGVRGANGVLMITTRRGKEGKPELTVTATQSFASLTREPPRLHSLDYIKYRNQSLANDDLPTPFTPEIIAKFENPLAGLNPNDPDYQQKADVRNYMYPDNDYYRLLVKRWSPQTVVNANLTGGTDKISYFMNIGYIHQGGNINTEPKEKLGYDPSMKMDRYSFRTNVDYKATSSLSFFLNLGTYIESVNMPGTGWQFSNNQSDMSRALFLYTLGLMPISPGPYTIEGFGVEPGMVLEPAYLNGERYLAYSPFEMLNYHGYVNDTRANLNSSVGANWDLGFITPGLSLKGMLSFDSWSRSEIQGTTTSLLYIAHVNAANDELSFAPYRAEDSRLSLSKDPQFQQTNYRLNGQASIVYNRKIGLHDTGGMILAQRDYWESTGADIPYNVLGVSGRVTYNYDARYFGEVNIGYNGSEQFAPTKRYGFFPAFSIGWAVSNERFLQGNHILTFLKLRASTGRVGNDQMGSSRFLYMDNITVNRGGGYHGSLAQGAYVSEGLLGNAYLTWELAQKYNAGMDVHIIQDFKASFDVFRENRSQILLSRSSVPSFQGVPSGNIPRVNLGEMENKGFEVELSYTKEVLSDMLVEVRGNFGYNKNKILKFDEVPRDDTYYYKHRTEGFPYGQSWGYEIDWNQDGGYWTPETLADPNRIPYSFGTPRPGDFVYKDLNGDGIIDDRDQAPIGYGSIPRITWGAAASMQYKDFDIYIFFQGLGQYHTNYSSNGGVVENLYRGTYFPYHYTAWTQERWLNDDKITYPSLSSLQNTNHRANSFFVMNRSFTRFKNAEIGYTLPPNLLRVAGISKMRIYVSGQNIFIWSPKFRLTHLDPENDNSVDYPQTRNFSFGTSITF